MIIQTTLLRVMPGLAASGWMDDLESWLWDLVKKYYIALGKFWTDVLLSFFRMLRDVSLFLLNHIPTPSFLSTHTIGEFLGSAGPTVGWLVNVMRLPEAMALILAGISFRLLRKLMTLGQW